jgi:hypothetical protein
MLKSMQGAGETAHKAPCYECTERRLKCHSTCEKYKADKEWHEAKRKAERDFKRLKSVSIESVLRHQKRVHRPNE